jgi:hypothetical protein
MISAVWFVVAASIGIDVGWQPVDEGGYEFLLQIDPAQLETLKAGEPLTSDLPPLPGRVVRVHWMVGTDPLPQTTLPAATPENATPQDAVSQDAAPPATAPTDGTTPAEKPAGDPPLESTTTNRPIAPAMPGELSLTDGRTATNSGSAGAASHDKRSTTSDVAAQQPELPLALAVPPASGSSLAIADESAASDAWHSATPATRQEPASAVAAAGYAQLEHVGPVDPSETDVDLSDGLDDTPASIAPRLDKQPGYVAATPPWSNTAADTATAATASTGGVIEQRARPATATTDAPPPADNKFDASTDTNGKSETDESALGGDSSAPSAPRPLAWLMAMATLGASLAGNVFFFWGFVDAKRRYRTALRDSGLLPT